MLSDERDLWDIVRQKISDSKTEEQSETIQDSKKNDDEMEIDYIKQVEEQNGSREEIRRQSEAGKTKLSFDEDFAAINILNEGVFAGFLYIFGIMIILGILSIPGSISASLGGFFGGKKAGDPTRALTAAMLPFLIIAAISFLASSGALPPGSGPNDVATEIREIVGHQPEENVLGPISKMPDSNSSVFVSVVTFAFIGGLYNVDKNSWNNSF